LSIFQLISSYSLLSTLPSNPLTPLSNLAVRRVGLINGLLGGLGLGGSVGLITHGFQTYGAKGLAEKGESWGKEAWKEGQEKVQEGKEKVEKEVK